MKREAECVYVWVLQLSKYYAATEIVADTGVPFLFNKLMQFLWPAETDLASFQVTRRNVRPDVAADDKKRWLDKKELLGRGPRISAHFEALSLYAREN